MPRKPNASIGYVLCPHSGELAAIRKDKRGKLYYVSRMGPVPCSTAYGQNWILENAKIWGPESPPDPSAPDWIVRGDAAAPIDPVAPVSPVSPVSRSEDSPAPSIRESDDVADPPDADLPDVPAPDVEPQ